MTTIRQRFETQPPGPDASRAMIAWRERFADLAEEIFQTTPVTREQSLALTKLEEVKYWVNQSVIVYDNEQQRLISEGENE